MGTPLFARLMVCSLLLFTAAPARAEPVQMTALSPVQVVRETAATATELGQLAAQLGDASPATRRRAFAELTRLGPDALDAIAKRLTQLAADRPPLERVLTIMTDFREVQGEERADAPVDLAAGVLTVLGKRRSDEIVAAAEPLLLLRSLEAVGSPQAAELALEVFALEDKAWRWESQRSLQRFGKAMLPALVLHETRHDKSWVRRFCRWGIDELGLRKPGLAVQELEVTVLAALLRAYGHTLRFDAMPVIVSYVDDARILVRQAARWSIAQFGRNAIWQIREAYLNATGKDANPDWGHERALRELYAFHDGPRKERVAQALKLSEASLQKGDEAGARQALEQALRRAPTDDALAQAASAYAQLGERALGRDDLVQAELDYRRALRLDASHAAAASWRAELSFIEAEQRLSAGVVDVPAYRRTLELDPSHERAEHILDVLSGEAQAREKTTRRVVAWLAAALLAVAGLSLLRREPVLPELDDDEAEGDPAEQDGTHATAGP